jgi:hypothetical protein
MADAEQKQNNIPDPEYLLDSLVLEIIGKMERGESVILADYVAQYPQIAADLQAALANYWFGDRAAILQLRQDFLNDAYAKSWQTRQNDRLAQERATTFVQKLATGGIESLLERAAEKNIEPDELAERANLTPELLEQLDERAFRLFSLPVSLIERLAEILELSAGQIVSYLSAPRQSGYGVAEASVSYLGQSAGQQDFGQTIADDYDLTAEQRAFWLDEVQRKPLRSEFPNS